MTRLTSPCHFFSYWRFMVDYLILALLIFTPIYIILSIIAFWNDANKLEGSNNMQQYYLDQLLACKQNKEKIFMENNHLKMDKAELECDIENTNANLVF